MSKKTLSEVKSEADNLPIETHPFPPYIPDNAKILIMGTFPPGAHRWAIEFYYPNPTNDFWKMMGLIFYNDAFKLYNRETRQYDLPEIKSLLDRFGIALSDTGYKIRRLKGNASDKFLDIVEPQSISKLLDMMPECRAIASTGEKASEIIAVQTNSEPPKTGEMVDGNLNGRPLKIFRMPSTSRAYPLALEKKAEMYRKMLQEVGIFASANK